MNHFLSKPFRWAIIYSIILTVGVTYVLLDTFVIPRAYASQEENVPVQNEQTGVTESPDSTVTGTSYEDGNIAVSLETLRAFDTTVHIADVTITDIRYLKTALAGDQYGRNIKEPTSEMASEHNAIFAVNGDFYGSREAGFVLRNGTLYRDGGDGEALVLDGDGDLTLVPESGITAEDAATAWQIWSFGPALISGNEIRVDESSEITGRSANSNPRTAIGQAGPLHYIFIVSEGRTEGNAGLSLLQLAQIFEERGCSVAYNLDGGGSSTMYFNGTVVNKTATSKKKTGEREVSDIVYIGYE
jgi:exopolysaccharide biosynthesis protein